MTISCHSVFMVQRFQDSGNLWKEPKNAVSMEARETDFLWHCA